MVKKNLLSVVIALIFTTLIASKTFPLDNSSLTFRKQTEIQQVKPKKPVRIKLKRLASGKYTWDLTGDDADEIVKIDRKLRKLLNVQ